MFWIALASQLSMPLASDGRGSDPRGLFRVDDFPAYLLSAGVSRTVYTRTTVRPDGSIDNCVAEMTSGDAKLDAYTCAIIVKRAKFLPAAWIDGSATFGVFRVPVSWRIANSPPSGEDMLSFTVPDLELSVNQLPKGAHKIAAVTVEVGSDEDGHPVSCAAYPPPKGHEGRYFPQLVPIACEQITKTFRFHAPLDDSKKPSRSVQTASVHFILDH